MNKPRPNPNQDTLRRYFYEWEYFVRWCRRHNKPMLPSTPSTVAEYISLLPTYYAASKASSAIAYAHKVAHLKSPTWDRRVSAAKRHLAQREGLKWPPIRFKKPRPKPRPEERNDPWQNPQ